MTDAIAAGSMHFVHNKQQRSADAAAKGGGQKRLPQLQINHLLIGRRI
jgi:hypothetical protein